MLRPFWKSLWEIVCSITTAIFDKKKSNLPLTNRLLLRRWITIRIVIIITLETLSTLGNIWWNKKHALRIKTSSIIYYSSIKPAESNLVPGSDIKLFAWKKNTLIWSSVRWLFVLIMTLKAVMNAIRNYRLKWISFGAIIIVYLLSWRQWWWCDGW